MKPLTPIEKLREALRLLSEDPQLDLRPHKARQFLADAITDIETNARQCAQAVIDDAVRTMAKELAARPTGPVA